MGKPSRDKGQRFERECVRAIQDAGFAALKIPLSGMGQRDNQFAGDIAWPLLGRDTIWEAKCRGDGFKFLYDALATHYGLIVKKDRERPLAVLPLDLFLKIAAAAERGRA